MLQDKGSLVRLSESGAREGFEAVGRRDSFLENAVQQ